MKQKVAVFVWALFYMRKFLLLFLILAFGGLLGGCRSYRLIHVEDVKLQGDQMYLLVLCETGIDHTSRFSHSAALQPKRRTLILVSGDISGSKIHPKSLGKLEFESERLLAPTDFKLVSTNTIGFWTGSNVFEIWRVGDVKEFQSIHAERVSFNPSGTILIACGDSSVAYRTDTMSEVSVREHADLLKRHCMNLNGVMVRNSVISDDLAELVIQDFTGATVKPLEIWGEGGMHSTVALTNSGEIVQGISKSGNATRIFVSEYSGDKQKAALVSLDGQVIQQTELQVGKLVFDGRFDPIISVPEEGMFHEGSEEQFIEVWKPGGNERSKMRVDTKEWLRAIGQ